MALKTFSFFALAFGQDLEPGRTSPNDLCRPADDSQGGCLIDGTNCDGTPDEFLPYNLTIKKWNNDTKTYSKVGLLESHAMVGNKDDWQMYLHGPMIRPTRAPEDASLHEFAADRSPSSAAAPCPQLPCCCGWEWAGRLLHIQVSLQAGWRREGASGHV